MTRKLHIGALARHEGWETLNISPGRHVDHVLDAADLSAFPDNTFAEIYASHIVEHLDYIDVLLATLKEWLRVLEPGGRAMISVPDLGVLSQFIVSESLTAEQHYAVMRMMFGGHIDEHDYHVVGLNESILTRFLQDAGYVNIRKVDEFGLFDDSSTARYLGVPISLNLIAEKAKARAETPKKTIGEMTVHEAIQSALEDQKTGRVAEALTKYQQILANDPDNIEACNLLGILHGQTGRPDLAAEMFRRSLDIDPGNFHAHNNMGTALKELGRIDEAIDAYRKAVELNPGGAGPHSNLAGVLRDKGLLDEAIAESQEAIRLDPNSAHAYHNLGTAYKDKGLLQDAISAFEMAIQLKPDFADAISNRGNTLMAGARFDAAIVDFKKAIAIQPGSSKFHNNLGGAYLRVGNLSDAIACFRKAVALDPDFDAVHSNLIYSMNYLEEYDENAIFAESRRWAQGYDEVSVDDSQFAARDRSRERPLRVGYVSPDLKEHPVAFFFETLLAHHDPDQIETFCYADLLWPDEISARLQRLSQHWRNTTGLADSRVAEMIDQDRIDILVDLAGHTADNRLPVFARRGAPIQVNYLGYPNTTGLRNMDYRLTDALADPPGIADEQSTEELIRLPDVFLCFAEPDVPPSPARSGPVRFGSFNAIQKIDVPLVRIWSEILGQVPESKLVLKTAGLSSQDAQQSLIDRFASCGIGEDRLELRPAVPGRRDHLMLYNEVDIGLDTYPYHGTTTTCEAMWMGVPVITLAGESHRSRVGVSLLSSVGLGELVAETSADYVRFAVELANDRSRLAELRQELRGRMQSSPLTDAPRFARHVEAAYRDFWHKWLDAQ